MQESPNRPTHYDLMKLPQRAIVAYALRCARRLRPLFSTAAGDSEDNPHSQAVEKALQIAERFCRAEADRTADVFTAAKAAAKGAIRPDAWSSPTY